MNKEILLEKFKNGEVAVMCDMLYKAIKFIDYLRQNGINVRFSQEDIKYHFAYEKQNLGYCVFYGDISYCYKNWLKQEGYKMYSYEEFTNDYTCDVCDCYNTCDKTRCSK